VPTYLYLNPKTGEVKEVIQRMTEPHVYSENGVTFNRVFTIPQGAFDTRINPESSKDFVNKMGRKTCKLGDMLDESKIASERREKLMGKDPVKEKYFQEYSRKRKGKKHPSTFAKPSDIQVEITD